MPVSYTTQRQEGIIDCVGNGTRRIYNTWVKIMIFIPNKHISYQKNTWTHIFLKHPIYSPCLQSE